MKLQSIKVSQAYESATNPRGDKFEGPVFNELVASVKEKGVLVPVIVRPKKNGNKLYEIVAGNRRFRASVKAGLKEIPARIENYSDEETQEVQIIENLQREDVHPIEEGIAYRKLIEESNYEIKVISAKVGKSVAYVRQRLFLTNLSKESVKAYRKGEINDGHAVLIAKLSPDDQAKALWKVKGALEWGKIVTVKELEDWIKFEIYDSLKNQPWLKNKKANEAVGPCTLCPPNEPTLFGNVKEGACTDKKCWSKKMKKYIAYMVKERDMVRVSESYGGGSKTVLSKNYYTTIFGKKDRCEYARQGVIVNGSDVGKVIWICFDSKCKEHGKDHAETEYALTPEEKKKHQEKQEKVKAKHEADEKKRKDKKIKEGRDLLKTLSKIKYPISDGMFDILFDLLIEKSDEFYWGDDDVLAEVHGWKPEEVNDETDFENIIRENVEKMSREEKLQFIFEMYIRNSWNLDEKKLIKKIKALKK